MKELTCLQILKAARAKIAKADDWGRGDRASRANFESCCVAEAIEECGLYWLASTPERKRVWRTFRNCAGIDDPVWGDIVQWNDQFGRTHREVMAAFNSAIACVRLT